MRGKICLITGASSGIGKATALGLAKMGATVVMLCRNKSRGEAASAEIKEKSGNENVNLMIADLSSQKEVKNMVHKFKEKYQKLHILINNAGVYFTKWHAAANGIEMTFAVNYLASFLLTNLLLDFLKVSSPARIINIAGVYHKKGTIDFEDLQSENLYSGAKANNQTQLARVLFTFDLARRLERTGVTVNCLHPGAIATNLVNKDPDFPAIFRFLYKLMKPLLKAPERGAETILYLASSPEVQDITGNYFVNKKSVPSAPKTYDKDLAQKLWDVSLNLTKLER